MGMLFITGKLLMVDGEMDGAKLRAILWGENTGKTLPACKDWSGGFPFQQDKDP